MGYELRRFVSEVDEEFLCQICKLVIENPVQIPCDHSFCYDCIKRRIASERTCPVDLIRITISGELPVFKPPCVAFQSVGCPKTVKLENLGDHVRSCEYNSNAEVICDKGCNLTITRREYLANNCYSHLKLEVMKLDRRVNFQRKRFEGLATCLYDRIKKQNDELGRHHAQKQQLENVIERHQQEIAELSGKRISNNPIKWQICHNMKIDESNYLEIDDYKSSTFAFVQAYYALNQAQSFFHIKLSKSSTNSSVQRNLIWIGLTRKGHPIVRNPESGSIACIWNGRIQVDKECVAIGPKWEDGDVIKLAIEFPISFTKGVNESGVVCLYKNEKRLFEKRIQMPHDGFYPTICIYGSDTKVAYGCN